MASNFVNIILPICCIVEAWSTTLGATLQKVYIIAASLLRNKRLTVGVDAKYYGLRVF